MWPPPYPSWSSSHDSFGHFQYLRPEEYARGQVPWCLKPQRLQCHSDIDLDALKTWRREVAALVDKRIAAYEEGQTPYGISEPVVGTSGPAASRVATITELVERILQNADVVTLLIATGVCKKWRDIAGYVMRRGRLANFNREPYVAPVRFYDAISEKIAETPMPRAELENISLEFRDDIQSIYDRCESGTLRPKDLDKPDIISMIYLPGKYTQNPTAREDYLLFYDDYYNDHLLSYDIYISFNNLFGQGLKRRWIDLSQFELNPCFLSLFPQSISTDSGIVKITLPPSMLSPGISGWHNLPSTAMAFLDSQLTHPPVVSLNISTWVPQLSESRPRPRKALHIFNVRNVYGITVRQLISAMKEAYPLVVEHWLHWTKLLRTTIGKMHWDQDIWIIENAPKLLVSLDPNAHGGDRFFSNYYLACMYAMPDRDDRQAQWMPKSMFKHANARLVEPRKWRCNS